MILISLIIGIFGLIMGSFLTAVIHRLSDLKSIIRERSHCRHCKKELGLWDLIPLLSFVILAGKCRFCKKKISWQYPLVEFSTALIFMLTYLKFGFSVHSVFLDIVGMGVIVIAGYDLQKMLIPDEIVLFLGILALLYYIYASLVDKSFNILISSFGGALIFGGVILFIYLISKGKWMGFGDIKLAGLIGFILSLHLTIVGFFIIFLIGGLIGLVLIALGRKGLKDKIPFAPIMILGFLITLFWGERILAWYLNIAV